MKIRERLYLWIGWQLIFVGVALHEWGNGLRMKSWRLAVKEHQDVQY